MFEAEAAELQEIATDTRIFKDMIEDTDQFISAHLDSVRNEIIKLSLFIEIGSLVLASGAVVSGIFGMNLMNYFEKYEHGDRILGSSQRSCRLRNIRDEPHELFREIRAR